jgi:hypothetical protein
LNLTETERNFLTASEEALTASEAAASARKRLRWLTIQLWLWRLLFTASVLLNAFFLLR